MLSALAILPAAQAQQSTGLPWWFWLLLLVVVIVAFIWWQRRSEGAKAPTAVVKAPEPASAAEALPAPEPAVVTRAVEAEMVEAVAAPAEVEEASAVLTPPKPPSRPWKSSAWRTREWQPKPPAWYPKWKYRRPTAG
jgi:hypothetical protein